MLTTKEYLQHAARADELAAQADAPEHKQQIAAIARIWRELAKQRERLLQGDKKAK